MIGKHPSSSDIQFTIICEEKVETTSFRNWNQQNFGFFKMIKKPVTQFCVKQKII